MRLKLSAPAAASAVLMALLGLQLVHGWRALRPTGGAPVRTEATAPRGPAPSSVAAIIHGHLFGEAPVAAQVDPSVQLVLSGTLAADDPKQGFAIIASAGTPAQFYATGAALPGGAVLTEVYDTRALVDRGGVVEELRLPRERGLLAFAGVGELAAPTAPAAAPVREVGDSLVRRSILGALPANVDAVRVLRPQAVVGEGKVLGYELHPAHPEQLGIRSGDQLVAVNGTRFKDAEQAAAVFQDLAGTNAATVELTLVHAGEPYRVTVDAEALRWRRR